MELATFGAILSYAITLEGELVALYGALAAQAPADLQDALDRALKAGQKRLKVLERTRRENVAEMILEPISGFRSEDYALALAPAGSDAAEAWRAAEQTAINFYTTGARKLSIPEVKRIFERLAKEHAGQLPG